MEGYLLAYWIGKVAVLYSPTIRDLLNRDDSILVVVSPLFFLDLMKDQVNSMIFQFAFVHQLLRNRY